MHLFTKGQYLAYYVPAPGFVTSQDMLASEEGNCTGGEEKDSIPSNVSEEKIKVHRGGRYPYDIQVETLARTSGKDQLSCGSLDSKLLKWHRHANHSDVIGVSFYKDMHIQMYIIYL